ncbi:hypothetical protein [Bauldia litoralis]|uniref:hypothetical protein n=1 Tax=Bauldia litoralis TaxID=665467 RepID=UPI003263BC63
MEKGLQAAVRRFPLKSLCIKRLASADETFLSLCSDLADAEAAMALWALSDASERESRQNEYEILANELAIEIGQLLDLHACEQDVATG